MYKILTSSFLKGSSFPQTEFYKNQEARDLPSYLFYFIFYFLIFPLSKKRGSQQNQTAFSQSESPRFFGFHFRIPENRYRVGTKEPITSSPQKLSDAFH
jgi:hypothetical protein